jgi:hypothetical protein
MLFTSLQETSVHTLWLPDEAALTRRAARRQARRVVALASGLERVVADASHSPAWGAPTMSTLISRPVASASAGALSELAARLRAGLVDATSIDEIDRFLTDGVRSPLYGTDPAAARFEALRLLDLSSN